MGHHAFTVDEANEMLPEVRATLSEIQDLRDAARSKMDHSILVAEHDLRQRLAELRLAHTRGSQEDKRTDGPLRIL